MLLKLKKKIISIPQYYRRNVHIISYPKCGRTWLRLIIGTAVQEEYSLALDDPSDLEEVYESCSRKGIKIPLILVSHDDNPQLKNEEGIGRDKSKYKYKKIIFLIRDPRDVIVSYYYEIKYRRENYNGSIEDLVYDKKGGFLSIIQFYNIWAEAKDTPKDFHLVRYEQLKENTYSIIRSLLNFSGMQNISDSSIEKAINFCSFENMRRIEKSGMFNVDRLLPNDKKNVNSFKTRKGIIGGYKDEFDNKVIEYMNMVIDSELNDLYSYYK